MTDVVERLRKLTVELYIAHEAADEIEQLRTVITNRWTAAAADEALLRQALDVLVYHYSGRPEDADLIAALRKRVGDTK